MTIPDGFLFDFSDPTDPQFYIVEVELVQHGFYAHIFPQITKFFAFYKTGGMQKTLVDKLHSIIDGDITLKSDFKGKLGNGEIYKFLSDILGSSQNILLISDDSIRELREIMDTYSETWGRMVKFLEVRKFTNGADVLFSLTPDFETLPYSDSGTEPEGTGNGGVTEKYHLDNASEEVLKIYEKIKQTAAGIDHRLVFNPQKYYISIKASKNIVFLTIRKSKIRFIALMPEEEIRSIVKNHVVVALSPPVQKFYNSPCASIDLRDTKHFEEIEQVMKLIVSRSQWGT
jgi:predicted transport protein